jgi:DNA-binding beta-propeller fold protein YncE
MEKWKRRLIICVSILVPLLAIGGWMFQHWLGFMLRSPMPVSERYDWPMTVVAGVGTPGFVDGDSPKFNKPIRFAPFGPDTVLVADINNHALRIVHRNGKTETLAGGPDKQGYKDGPVDLAQFNSPHGVAVRNDGAIAVAEASNHTIRLLMPKEQNDGNISSAYTVSTLAGSAGEKGFQDGPAGKALFNAPHAVTWGTCGVLFVADIGNSRLRQIKDGEVTTVAGTGKFGYADGPLEKGTLQYPMDLSIDSAGRILIADGGTGYIRRYVSHNGLSSPWQDIRIDMPHGVTNAPYGGLVVAEMRGHRICLLTSDNKLIRLCGTGQPGSGPHQLKKPAAVLIHSGYLWIADLGNHRVLITRWPSTLDLKSD